MGNVLKEPPNLETGWGCVLEYFWARILFKEFESKLLKVSPKLLSCNVQTTEVAN